jgi:DsbC/DsbD-like thiol-disulfide interchange protein
MIDVAYLFQDFGKMVRMASVFKAAITCFFASAIMCAPPARAQEPSRVELLRGADEAGDTLWAGIGITLADGWKTYWKDPGQGGLPPRIDFSASTNISAVEVHWPVPQQFKEGSHTVLGYTSHVVLPVKVTVQKPGQPAQLNLTMDYGICETLCVPKRAEVTLAIDPRKPAPAFESAMIEAFRKRLPQ